MARLLATRLASAGAEVAIVMDEQDGPADCTPFTKVLLCGEALGEQGLKSLPQRWRWMCGDMCYYLAAAALPGFARYVLIESDVFVPSAGVADLVRSMSSYPADAIAARLEKIGGRRFSNTLYHFGVDPNWGCLFPLTAVSPNVIDEMKKLRAEQLRRFPDIKLNDEAVLAGAVNRGKLSYAKLEDVIPDQVPVETFSTNPPHLYEVVRDRVDEHRLFHPVIPFATILARLDSGEKAYNRRRLRNVLKTAPRPMRQELRRRLETKK